MKKILILFSIISFSKMFQISHGNGPDDIKKLEGDIIYNYISSYDEEVENILQKIKSLDKNIYKRDKEIVNYWYYIDNEMIIYEQVAPKGLPETNEHAFVVLGYELNDDGSLKKEGKGRCDVAYESAKLYQNSLIFLTGGSTAKKNKTVTEAGQMEEYLVKTKGLDKNRIIIESEAMDTIQNAKYTVKKLIDNNIKTITIITSEYHIKRANIIFKGVSMLMAENFKITPIQILENAVWKTSYKNEGKFFEGYALSSILEVKLNIIQIIRAIFNSMEEIVKFIWNKIFNLFNKELK